jgi:hypothetical protein
MPALRATHPLGINPHNIWRTNRGPARWTNRIQRGEDFRQVDLAFLHRAIIDFSPFIRPRLFSGFSHLYCPTVRPRILRPSFHVPALLRGDRFHVNATGDCILAALLPIVQETYPH